jgi:small conductance mechanosensitive channel
MELPKLAHLAVRVARLAVFVAALHAPIVALAQSAGAPAGPGPPAASQSGDAEIRALIAALEDEPQRQRLIAQLKALLAASEPAKPEAHEGIRATISERLSRLSENLVAGARKLFDIPELRRWWARQVDDPERRQMWLHVALAIAVTFAAGAAAEWLVRALLARPRRALEMRQEGRPGRETTGPLLHHRLTLLPLAAAYVALELIAVAAFGVAAHFTMPFVEPDPVTRDVTLAFVAANVIQRAVLSVGRGLLAPQTTGIRVVAASDSDANYLFVWLRRLSGVAVYGTFAVQAAALLGAPSSVVESVRLLVGLVAALLVIVLILQNRTAIASRLAGKAERAATALVIVRRRFADIWHVVAICYVVAVFAVWGLEIRDGFEFIWRATALTAVIVAAAVVVLRLLDRLVHRAFDIGDETRRRLPGLEARANRYIAIVGSVLRGMILFVAACAVLEAWRVDAFGWLGSDIGRRAVGAVFLVGILALLALFVWELASAAIERRLQTAESEPGGAGARARTLLPLLRNIIMITLAAIVLLVMLSQFGLDIGPLLAGAGIIGIAVGFGAQTLAKDVITGMFILLENQIGVGDVVRVGDRSGLVEALTIRTIRLRDMNGNVYIVPFSEVTVVENMTKDYSRYVFDVAVAYREDTDEVVAALKEIGEELAADPAFGPLILAPLEVLGVDKFADSAVVIKARITTKPIRQWDVGREFNRRMKKRFDALGIEIPFPHQTVYFGVGKRGDAPPARVHLDADVPASRGEKTKPAV